MISPSTKTFTPDEVTIQFAGDLVTGWKKVKITPNADLTEDDMSVDKEVCVTRINDPRYDVEITLAQTSASNDLFSTYARLVTDAPNMEGAIQPFTAKDLNGRTAFKCDNTWVKRETDIEYENKPTDRVWSLRAIKSDRVDGGNG